MPRNSSGTYSLPSGNPVVSNTLIQSTWANNTCSDLGSSITDSLDRNGRGAMLAALKNIDGTAVAPALTFSSEGTLGLYRVAAGVLGIAAGGALVLSIASTGLTFTNPLVLPIGSATAPSVTFTSNTNTGLYSPGTNQVALTTNGVGALFVSASQNVGIGGANALGKLQVIGGDVVIDNAANYSAKNSGGTASSIMSLSSGNQLQFGNSGAVTSQTWATGGTTRLNLTNTALQPTVLIVSALAESFRTANDAALITAYNTASTTRTGYLQFNAGANVLLYAENGASLSLGTNGSARVNIDTSGNVGFRVQPSAWGALTAIEGSAGALAFNGPGSAYLMQNVYFNGSNWIYKTAAAAGLLVFNAGQLIYETAPAGTAGASVAFTQALTVDANSTLTVGPNASNPNNRLVMLGGRTNIELVLKTTASSGGAAGSTIYFGNSSTDTIGYVNYDHSVNALTFAVNSALRLTISSAGVITDQNGFELGYKGLPQQNQAGAYTLVAGDRGKHVYQRAAANVTVPSGTFSVGDAVTIVNGTASNITVVQGASVTMQQAGTTNTGNRTLLANGVCTLICVSSNTFYISGTIT